MLFNVEVNNVICSQLCEKVHRRYVKRRNIAKTMECYIEYNSSKELITRIKDDEKHIFDPKNVGI
jgi:hypothetical protein